MSKVSLLSLGCPKNLVDSEKLISKLQGHGILYSSDPASSDILIINTCGFIEAAKKESVDEILRMAQLKGRGKKLIVMGCLAKRYGEQLKEEIPEIDALWGVGQEDEIVSFCRSVLADSGEFGLGERLTETPYAYLKIAEGCDRQCTYCVIPQIRGSFESLPPEQVLKEAESLIRAGSKELILVAQDITEYGSDLNGFTLSRLLRELAGLDGDFRIRLLYLYPTSVTDELIETIASEEKICKYIDMPLQHSETRILRLMGRGGSRSYYEKLIAKIRRSIPEVAIRSTLIVGFPQETEDEFEAMLRFVEKVGFDRLGVFMYSKEEGSAAARLKGHLTKKIKAGRFDRIMTVQAGISLKTNIGLVGRTFRALIDDIEDDIAIARLCSQAPEIDGVVLLKSGGLEKGSFVEVRVDEAYDYDLKGSVVK